MSNEAQVILDVWEAVRDHIPHGKRPVIAQDVLVAFVDYGFESSDVASIVDEDPDLAAAFEAVYLDADEDEDEE